jgi:hypothetical protein
MENLNTFFDKLLKNQFNEDEQIDIVSKDPCLIMHMFNATSKVQEKAISKEPNTIRHISDQSEYIKMFAIKQGCLLKYIKEPDFNMKIEAIMINPINIIYIDNPDMSLLDLAFTCGAYSIIKKSLETNNCEKSKATLKALDDRHFYLLKKDRNDKNCTIS